MSKISNQYGRALEYAIVERLIQNLSVSQLLLSPQAVKAQTRDCSRKAIFFVELDFKSFTVINKFSEKL
jgi:hypothetical protein